MFRQVAGLMLAACVALLARRTRSLTDGGAIAATGVGWAAVGAGWDWGTMLVVYFIASTLVSRTGRAEKHRRTASVAAKGGTRDAVQVLANGGVFAVGAVAMLLQPDVRWMALAAGSLAASAADTWATEVGTFHGGPPRSILSARRVQPGTSGGVTAIGSLAAVAGAGLVVALALAFGWPAPVAALAMVGGLVGAFLDSLVGAVVQSRRWCDACECETERAVHDCGAATRSLRGVAWIDNDAVNFISTAAGGLLAACFAR
jgi:uncharacterized protein (TIGR00297 family)